jgi:hypothetical protein
MENITQEEYENALRMLEMSEQYPYYSVDPEEEYTSALGLMDLSNQFSNEEYTSALGLTDLSLYRSQQPIFIDSTPAYQYEMKCSVCGKEDFQAKSAFYKHLKIEEKVIGLGRMNFNPITYTWNCPCGRTFDELRTASTHVNFCKQKLKH